MKTKVKGVALAMGLALIAGTSAPPAAMATGIPVVDLAGLAQAISQYQQLVAQLENMQAQLKQAQQQYEALTGSRGMENLLRNESRNVIPTNWQETLAQMNGGQISGLAQSIKSNAAKVDTATLQKLLPSSTVETSEGFANSAASSQAAAGKVYDNAAGRFSRLQALMDAIPQATDLKGVADLQARIGVEQTMLQNETIQMIAMQQAASSQQSIQQQQVRESMLDKPSSGSNLPSALR
ncbi:type IV secretion system protein [Xanthomonas campestris]|uniref:type IV secretion system protein n=1 Tax=Xanthomonas campestris TaxID=339 RepID=UPI003557ED14